MPDDDTARGSDDLGAPVTDHTSSESETGSTSPEETQAPDSADTGGRTGAADSATEEGDALASATESRRGEHPAVRRPQLEAAGGRFEVRDLSVTVSSLQAVSHATAKALSEVGIHTVYDLARSNIFGIARQIFELAHDPEGLILDVVPSDWVDLPAGKHVPRQEWTLAKLLDVDIKYLRSVSDEQGQALSAALGISTIGQFAQWSSYLEAVRLLEANDTVMSVIEQRADKDADGIPDFLLPTNTNAAERFTYVTYVMGKVYPRTVAGASILKPIVEEGQLDLAAAIERADFGHQTVAEGARLTYSQSWYMQGMALGDLRKSVPLAAGEIVRIAHVDWSRTQTGNRAEAGTQAEQLDNQTTHKRAMNEVASAVATESQSGFTDTSSRGTATQSGKTTSPGVLGGLFPGGSTNTSSSTNTGKAVTLTSSEGTRDVNSSMSQNIADSTDQHASAARSRRATVVEEVAENEAADASTRILVNYNHAHALNVLYFEIVQNFRVETRLEKVEKLILVPVKMVDLTERELTPSQAAAIAPFCDDLDVKELLLRRLRGVPLKLPPQPMQKPRPQPAVEDLSPGQAPPALTVTPRVQPLPEQISGLLAGPGSLPSGQIQVLSNNAFTLPPDLQLTEVTSRDVQDGTEIRVLKADGTTVQGTFSGNTATFDEPVIVSAIASLYLEATGDKVEKDAVLALQLAKRGKKLSSIQIQLTPESLHQPLLMAQKALDDTESIRLAADLQRNKVRYNQALWDTLDETVISMLLADFTYGEGSEKVELRQWIDPKPVGYSGNYLVFKMNVEPAPTTDPGAAGSGSSKQTVAEEWRDWRESKGLGEAEIGKVVRSQIVAMPTDGLFSEAVLGQAICAEKIDISRLIDWAEMPIPLVPPEINSVDLGSRHADGSYEPGQFANPMVNIVAPTSLPDPVLAAGTLQAVNNGNLFRDMSAAAATIGAAQASLASAQQGATSAGQQATDAQNAAVKAAGELASTVAQVAGTALTAGAAGVGGLAAKGLTAAGGLMNAGKAVDVSKAAKVDAAAAAKSGSASGPSPSGGHAGSGEPTTGGTPADPSSNGQEIGYEERGYLAALGQTPATAGMVKPPTARTPAASTPAARPKPKPAIPKTIRLYVAPRWAGSEPAHGRYLAIITPEDPLKQESPIFTIDEFDGIYREDVEVPAGQWEVQITGENVSVPVAPPSNVSLPGIGHQVPLQLDVRPKDAKFLAATLITVPPTAKSVMLTVSPVSVTPRQIEQEITVGQSSDNETTKGLALKAFVEGKIRGLFGTGVEATGNYQVKTTVVDETSRKVKVTIGYDVYSTSWEVKYTP
jgi:hypothetical protein